MNTLAVLILGAGNSPSSLANSVLVEQCLSGRQGGPASVREPTRTPTNWNAFDCWDIAGALERVRSYEEQIVLVGHSWGGATAVSLAHRCSRKIDLMITLDPASWFSGNRKRRPANVRRWINAYSPLDIGFFSWTNAIASVGGRWGHCEEADVNLELRVVHGVLSAMLSDFRIKALLEHVTYSGDVNHCYHVALRSENKSMNQKTLEQRKKTDPDDSHA